LNAEEESLLRLQAALDGELDAEGAIAFERDCAADPALAARFARARALDVALREALPVEPAPAALRARIEAMAAPPRKKLFDAPPYALAASLALSVLAGYGLGQWRSGPPQDERALVSAFMRTQISGGNVDIANSDRHVIKPWLAHRAPLSVAALDLSAAGFPLAGGRVEALGERIVPVLVYARREHRIDLTELPGTGAPGETGFSSLDGLHVARWSDFDRGYVAVSDLPEVELKQFVDLFRVESQREREEPSPR
jgi:anti-sigma factor RsiW